MNVAWSDGVVIGLRDRRGGGSAPPLALVGTASVLLREGDEPDDAEDVEAQDRDAIDAQTGLLLRGTNVSLPAGCPHRLIVAGWPSHCIGAHPARLVRARGVMSQVSSDDDRRTAARGGPRPQRWR